MFNFARTKHAPWDLAGDPHVFAKNNGKKQLFPPVHKADRLAGGGERVGDSAGERDGVAGPSGLT